MRSLFLALLTPSVVCTAQVKPLSSIPAYDCGLKKVMSILSRPTVLLSPDSNESVRPIVDEYCGYFGDKCTRKTSSQLSDPDYHKVIFVVGDIRKIGHWARLGLPIEVLPGGFKINGMTFTDSLDGLTFVDSNHIVVGGNSLQAIKDAQLAFTGGYDLTLLQKGKITWFGNYASGRWDVYNLQELKRLNYIGKRSASFRKIYLSRTYPDTINFSHTEAELRGYIQQFLKIYRIPVPRHKIDWFIHSDMQEYGTMSGLFGLTCPGNGSAGFSIRGEIHTRGYDIGLVKHEYSHYLFDNAIPQDHNPAFFVEGCVEYVTGLNDTALFRKRVGIARQYRDSLNYEYLIIKNKDFYGQYSSANYSVCGVFVKYLIDNYGVDRFKQYCLAADKSQAASSIFGRGFAELVQGYYKWVDDFFLHSASQ